MSQFPESKVDSIKDFILIGEAKVNLNRLVFIIFYSRVLNVMILRLKID